MQKYAQEFVKEVKEWDIELQKLLKDEKGRFRFYAVYAIGVENTDLEKMEPKLLAPNEKFNKIEARPCSLQLELPENTYIKVYIADYTKSIQGILDNDKIQQLRKILLKYRNVVQPRKKEHWGQFVPLGWKDNGGLTATYANCQGNTLPIIWGEGTYNNTIGKWYPLYRRYFNPWSNGKADMKTMFENIEKILKKFEGNIDDDFMKGALSYALNKRSYFFDKEGNNCFNSILIEINKNLQKENKKIKMSTLTKQLLSQLISIDLKDFEDSFEDIINNGPLNNNKDPQNINNTKFEFVIELLRASD